MADTASMSGNIVRDESGADWIEHIKRAAGQLTPVVVELISPRQSLHAYLVAVVTSAGRTRALLAPVHGPSMRPGTRAVVRPTLGERWVLHTVITDATDTTAALDLTSARFGRDADAEPGVLPGPGLLVLVVPGGVKDASGYVFPIRRIGQDFCQIEATTPLQPDTVLRSVEVVGDRRVLRRATARVLETVPIVRADGTSLFRCELSLAPISSFPPAPHDLVTDAREVRRLLEFAAMTHVRGWYEAPGWSRGTLSFGALGDDHAILHFDSSLDGRYPQASIRVGIELFAVQYELEVRVLSLAGAAVHTSLPMILRRRRSHRREQFVNVPDGERVRLTFVNPVSGATVDRRVIDLSFFGVRFGAEFDDAMLWTGLPLERAQLAWRDRVIFLGDLEVGEPAQAGEKGLLALASDSRITDDNGMVALVAACSHPEVRSHDGDDFSALHDAYVKAGLFAPHMHRNLSPIVAEATEVWRRMHSQVGDLVRTFVHPATGPVDGAVTLMRAWESAWVAQHFVDVSPSLNGATGKLQTAYLDHLLPRPDGRYLVFFIKGDNHVMIAYMRRFFSSVGTQDAAAQRTVELWVHAGGNDAPAVDRSRTADRAERAMIENACQRCFGSDTAAALSMTAEHFELPNTRASFARAQLVRERSCRVVDHAGSVAYALLEERSTPGINLTWMLNATWVLPVHATGHEDLSIALEAVVARPSQSPTGERFVNVPAGFDEQRLHAAGFVRLASVEMFILNRAGVHQFFQYASRRYGELDARSARRERRRNAPAASPLGDVPALTDETDP